MAKEETPVESTEETATTTEAPAEEVQPEAQIEEEREPENSPTLEDSADFDPLESGKQDAATNSVETPEA